MAASLAQYFRYLEQDQGATEEGASRLFQLIEKEDWEEAARQCNTFPEEADKSVVRIAGDKTIDWRRLPLHEACFRQPSKTIIDVLLKAYPLGAQASDRNGRVALHHACAHGASLDVVQKLIMAHPDSIDAEDIWLKTPLHVAQASSSLEKHLIVRALERGAFYYTMKVNELKSIAEVETRVNELKTYYEEDKDKLMAEYTSFENTVEADRQKIYETLDILQNELDASRAENACIKLRLGAKIAVASTLENKVKKQNEKVRNTVALIDYGVSSVLEEEEGLEKEVDLLIRNTNGMTDRVLLLGQKLEANLVKKVELEKTSFIACEESAQACAEWDGEIADVLTSLSRAHVTRCHKKNLLESSLQKMEVSIGTLTNDKFILKQNIEEESRKILRAETLFDSMTKTHELPQTLMDQGASTVDTSNALIRMLEVSAKEKNVSATDGQQDLIKNSMSKRNNIMEDASHVSYTSACR